MLHFRTETFNLVVVVVVGAVLRVAGTAEVRCCPGLPGRKLVWVLFSSAPGVPSCSLAFFYIGQAVKEDFV